MPFINRYIIRDSRVEVKNKKQSFYRLMLYDVDENEIYKLLARLLYVYCYYREILHGFRLYKFALCNSVEDFY